jgi:hypothetical protein
MKLLSTHVYKKTTDQKTSIKKKKPIDYIKKS